MKHVAIRLSTTLLAGCGAYEAVAEEKVPPTFMKNKSDLAKLYGKSIQWT